jgi:hypothetical protein
VSTSSSDDRFRTAARAYFVYGVVYAVGGIWLVMQGVGVPGYVTGPRRAGYVAFWIVVSVTMLLLIPFLLRKRRPWFERWILSRRDFARILSLFMAWRAGEVLRRAIRPEGASVAAPWGGTVSFQAGATVFFLVTVVALFFVARAAWTEPAK